jgi:hypothetical protein
MTSRRITSIAAAMIEARRAARAASNFSVLRYAVFETSEKSRACKQDEKMLTANCDCA